MSTLDEVILEYFLPEDEPHGEVPRLGDRVAVTIRSDAGVVWRGPFVVTNLSEATSGDGRAIVTCALDEEEPNGAGTGVGTLPGSLGPVDGS